MRGRKRCVCKVTPEGRILESYESIKEASEKNYLHPATVRYYCQRKNADCVNGYSFRWED